MVPNQVICCYPVGTGTFKETFNLHCLRMLSKHQFLIIFFYFDANKGPQI